MALASSIRHDMLVDADDITDSRETGFCFLWKRL